MSKEHVDYAKLRGLADALRERCGMGVNPESIKVINDLAGEIIIHAERILKNSQSF